MKNLKISQKLIVSFFIVIALFVMVSAYQLYEQKHLAKLQDEGATRSNALTYAKEIEAMGTKLYQVVADAVINRHLDETQKTWNEAKADANGDLANLGKVVDTDVERAWLRECEEHIKEFTSLFENEMLPLLKADGSMEEIAKVDAKFDEIITGLAVPVNKMVASIQAENNAADALFDSTITQVFSVSIIVNILAVAIAIVFTIILVNLIAKPLAKGVTFAKEISEGNLLATLEIDQKDEVGVLANALQEMVEKLKDIIGNVITGSDNIASASQQMSSTSQQLSQGANESAASVEQVSSTMEEMSSNIEQNSQNATHTEKISVLAYDGMKEMVNQSAQAVEANRTIADKIKIINDIAFQTNILALNAAVEAARAGEQGRGFAVVAAEVRKLAERSKIAADEIVSLSVKSLKLAEGVGKKMNDIMPEIEKTTRMVQEISAASAEQTNGATQINGAIQQMNTVTQQNASASEELSSSAEELASQAEQLKDIISFFQVERVSSAKHFSRVENVKKEVVKKHTYAVPTKKSSIKNADGVELHLHDNDHAFEKY